MTGESRLRLQVGAFCDCLHLLSQMRGSAQDLRSIAMGAVLRSSQGDPGAAGAAGAELVEQLGTLERLGAAYAPLIAAADEAATWAALRERELPPLATRAAGIIESVAGGGGASPAALEDLSKRSIRVDRLFAELAHMNATQVQRGAARIDASLKGLLAVSGLLLVVGGRFSSSRSRAPSTCRSEGRPRARAVTERPLGIVFPALREARGGGPHPDWMRPRIDHGALTSLLVA